MELQVFDNVKFEKENAVLRFNRFRRMTKVWQIFEVLVFLALISWSSVRVPAVMRVISGCFVEFSTYLFNHHVVFLIGNAIIVSLFVLCRQNDAVSTSGGGDLYDDYVKHSEAAAARRREPTLPPTDVERSAAAEGGGVDEEKQIAVRAAETETETKAILQCDDVAAAIEKATRQIKRFQRTQSEKLKQEIAVKPRRELRRSETESCRRTVSSGESRPAASLEAAEMETLSNEEFQRTVDAFIDKHWSKKKSEWNKPENMRIINY
ncbi:hypothetical protein BUALT_Bualt01G0029800 [Buddleja alternifolia]|uniref:Uncharacterized protein n=1 Tax=Buddleja alternifolia TaxID=168488 RepID=A0AAV6YCN8_9LAMI|nr:hypothetical protein BUALT_Bualt01G0029800 [Buddleja alternifolia]